MKIILLTIIASSFAHAEYMSNDKIMDGFVHPQKAPQMGHPVQYEPKSKVFGKKKHKKDKRPSKAKTQKSAIKRLFVSHPSSTPSPSATPTASPLADATPVTPSADGIDLRQFDSSIKEQGTPWCTAYAGAAGIENLLAQKLGKQMVPDLSEGHIFSMYQEYNVDEFASNVPGKLITTADQWARDSSAPSKSSYESKAKRKLVSISWIGDGDIEGAKRSLDKGHPVYTGIEVAADMASCLASIRPTSKITSGGHAVEFIGYQLDKSNKAIGGGYFIVKNSWSEGCGDHGYQYFPFSLCERMYCYFYEIAGVE